MTLLYLCQETSCKGKSLECHPAYHDAATGLLFAVEDCLEQAQVGWAAQNRWAAMKMQGARNMVARESEQGWSLSKVFGCVYISKTHGPVTT
jgi:hypothetical protein